MRCHLLAVRPSIVWSRRRSYGGCVRSCRPAFRTTELVGLGIEQPVECLLDALPNDLVNMPSYLLLIDLNHALFRCDQEEQTEVVTTIKDFAIEK